MICDHTQTFEVKFNRPRDRSATRGLIKHHLTALSTSSQQQQQQRGGGGGYAFKSMPILRGPAGDRMGQEEEEDDGEVGRVEELGVDVGGGKFEEELARHREKSSVAASAAATAVALQLRLPGPTSAPPFTSGSLPNIVISGCAAPPTPTKGHHAAAATPSPAHHPAPSIHNTSLSALWRAQVPAGTFSYPCNSKAPMPPALDGKRS